MIPTCSLRYLAAFESDRSRDKNFASVRAVERGDEIEKRSLAGARRAGVTVGAVRALAGSSQESQLTKRHQTPHRIRTATADAIATRAVVSRPRCLARPDRRR